MRPRKNCLEQWILKRFEIYYKRLAKSESLNLQARRKCGELRKMRALMGYRATKLKRESKIKSKQYDSRTYTV